MTDHDTKKITLRDFSLRILIDLHQPLRVRPDGDDHPPRARELLHERRRYRRRRRTDVNRVVRALLRVPWPTKNFIVERCPMKEDRWTHRVARRR